MRFAHRDIVLMTALFVSMLTAYKTVEKQGVIKMKVVEERYMIATKTHPVMFDDGCGNPVDLISEAYPWKEQDTANYHLSMYDKDVKEEYMVVKVEITYKF